LVPKRERDYSGLVAAGKSPEGIDSG
jgi:hypothetical protein